MPNLLPAKTHLSNVLLSSPYARLVTGVGIGSEMQEEVKVPSEEIVVFVEPVADCELDFIRKAIELESPGTPYVLLPSGRFTGLQARTGDSAGFDCSYRFDLPAVSGGTLGAVVQVANERYILGSNHVFAHNGRVPYGAAVVRPGTIEEVHAPPVGLLSHFVEMAPPMAWPAPPLPPGHVPGTVIATTVPKVPTDCALARVVPGVQLTASREVKPFGSSVPFGLLVQKTVRTNLTATASISLTGCDIVVDFSFGTYVLGGLTGVIGVEAFAVPGHSGAVVTTRDPVPQAVGLVTARTYSVGSRGRWLGYVVMMCPMDSVRSLLAQELHVAPDQVKFLID